MGQHLHLYVTKTFTLDEVEKWCHARAWELTELPSPTDQPIVDKVQREMDRLKRTDDHLKHWSNWVGPALFDFLVWTPHLCTPDLLKRATLTAASPPIHIRNYYPSKDFTQDSTLLFLSAHPLFIIWGDNDGI